jgi:hypothetical protein
MAIIPKQLPAQMMRQFPAYSCRRRTANKENNTYKAPQMGGCAAARFPASIPQILYLLAIDAQHGVNCGQVQILYLP